MTERIAALEAENTRLTVQVDNQRAELTACYAEGRKGRQRVGLFWRLRKAAKRLVLRCHLGPLIEYCEDCGMRQPIVWWSDDDLWQKVAGATNVLCPECFDRRAQRLGLGIRWFPQVEYTVVTAREGRRK